MTVKEYRDKINKLMTDAQAILLQQTVTKEDRARVDAMMAEVDELESQSATQERIEKWDAARRSLIIPGRPNPGEAPTGTPEEQRRALATRAVLQFMQGGMGNVDQDLRSQFRPFLENSNRERRDITTTTGAQFVPQLFYPVLIQAIKAYGPIFDLVTVKRTNNNGAPMKIGTINDTSNSIAVLGETVAATETDPTFNGSSLLSTDTATTGLIKVSEQELDDSYFDIDALIRDVFGIRLGRGLEGWITNGNGSNVASLLAGAHLAATTASGHVAAIGYSDITAVYSALDPGYEMNATWQMNSFTRGLLLGVTDTLGRPLFIPDPSSGAFDRLLGRPVKLNQSLANPAAASKSLLYGDFRAGYVFRVDGDLAIKRLNERYADTLEVGFIGYLRCGGISTDAGTHPLQYLQQAAS